MTDNPPTHNAGRIADIDILREWYIDFQTVHPFPDGNGRTGGIIVAAYSHQMHPLKGWLEPKQRVRRSRHSSDQSAST